ncbi:MAG: MafI family immunity protein [Methylomonas sp.]|jgi:hypothetical protein|uniref:MafI family immunity protein n=1 Tax=Methylomonas sp. TaxID=418 RepID=UPI0025FA6BFB|nr:MafI family immunity protein [Methylomonas sp.]MCK9609472.1 MafI family immunity protein [Methylomonas sp.]
MESNFDEVELLLSKLLEAVTPVLSESECAEVQSFIDVGEYGLALETAVDIFVEEKKIASAGVVTLVSRLVDLMSLDSLQLLQRLPQ